MSSVYLTVYKTQKGTSFLRHLQFFFTNVFVKDISLKLCLVFLIVFCKTVFISPERQKRGKNEKQCVILGTVHTKPQIKRGKNLQKARHIFLAMALLYQDV